MRNLTNAEIREVLDRVYKYPVCEPVDLIRNLRKAKISSDETNPVERIAERILATKVKVNSHVGVAMGQFLGQPITQMALSSFKKTGTREFAEVVTGSKLRKTLRWVEEDPRSVSVLKVKPGFPVDPSSMRGYASSVRCVRVQDVVEHVEVSDSELRFFTDNRKRYEFEISLELIKIEIETCLRFPVRINSPGVLAVKSEKSTGNVSENAERSLASKLNFAPLQSGLGKNFISGDVMDSVLKLKLRGIDGVHNVTVSGDKIIAVGSEFRELITMSFVDKMTSTSDDVYKVYQTLGIEAAREMIAEKIRELAGLSPAEIDRNVDLIANQMCARGKPLKIDRMGLKGVSASFLRRLSFENSTRVLKETISPVEDVILDPSAKIIVGKPLDSF